MSSNGANATPVGKLALRSQRAVTSLRRIPVIFQVQAAGLVLAVMATFAVGVLDTRGQYETYLFALPAVMSPTPVWHDEVDAFAQRLQAIFGINAETAGEFSDWILEAARRQQLAPELLASLIFTESSFRKDAVSHVGALGPAQIRPYWKSFCGSKMLRDPAENVYCGAQILAYFKEECGDARCALLSYNLGPRGMRMEQFASAGTRYVNRIDSHLERFEHYALENAAL
jgi:soluble lytic murein transglycosylase-like protein